MKYCIYTHLCQIDLVNMSYNDKSNGRLKLDWWKMSINQKVPGDSERHDMVVKERVEVQRLTPLPFHWLVFHNH